jgi:molybdate transport system regulatory protein
MKGTIVSMIEGAVSAEVDLDVAAGNVITAVITLGSAKNMGLKQGGNAYALFKASNVIVGVK